MGNGLGIRAQQLDRLPGRFEVPIRHQHAALPGVVEGPFVSFFAAGDDPRHAVISFVTDAPVVPVIEIDGEEARRGVAARVRSGDRLSDGPPNPKPPRPIAPG